MVQAAVRAEACTSLELVRKLPEQQTIHMVKMIKIKMMHQFQQ